ncbi:MAG TPA: hypothetical protein PLN52_05630 [Opitutaceae bacterium]|nr:hypothetical protein [Opitutaceae bacterium]
MSLINEALKKAQKQRTNEPLAPTAVGAPPPPRVAKRKPPMPAQTLVLIGGLCLVLIGILVGGAWFIFKSPSEPAPSVASKPSTPAPAHAQAAKEEPASTPATTVAATSTPAASPPAATPVPTSAPAPAPAAQVSLPTVSAPSSPTPSKDTPSPAAGVASPAVAAVTPAPTAAPTPEPDEIIQITSAHLAPRFVPQSPQVMAVVDTFKVSGIRASASDPKVLMNDRVFRLNDIVERTHGLRLTEIHTDRLTFVDEAGASYSKSF